MYVRMFVSKASRTLKAEGLSISRGISGSPTVDVPIDSIIVDSAQPGLIGGVIFGLSAFSRVACSSSSGVALGSGVWHRRPGGVASLDDMTSWKDILLRFRYLLTFSILTG